MIIERYLSEGGFAHVYLVRLPNQASGDDGAVLKRVAVPDKETLASMRTEVETMQKLRGRRHIVTYVDYHASQIKTGGFEVFLLMEYCNGGGLIDFMNTRLQNRLTEPEVLKIFSDVALGVADMHYLKPPLLHRDLKVENVLITTSGSSRRYKLCDFGSAAPPRPPATNATEGRLIEEDVQKHTTLQYRSPEMIDVYRKQPIDEKSDIWALGVLLYKLCYYKTPFEEQGQMAILNASFKFPGYPTFSDKLKKLIAWMLQEHPQARPNIYQVVREVSSLRGTDVPIKDIYAGRSQSEARRNQRLPPATPSIASPPVAGAYKAPVEEKRLEIPSVTPMRRGRPIKADGGHHSQNPSLSPAKASDPFHALDSKQGQDLRAPTDDIASRFPPLEQFSILHDAGGAFKFQSDSDKSPAPADDLSRRVTNALADEAFAQFPEMTSNSNQLRRPTSKPNDNQSSAEINGKRGGLQRPEIDADDQQGKRSPERPSMVSTGTMTSPVSSPPPSRTTNPNTPFQPVLRFPAHQEIRSLNQSDPTRQSELLSHPKSDARPSTATPQRPNLSDHRSNSQVWPLNVAKSPSSRPSLEIQRPSTLEADEYMHRSKSTNSKSRPVSESLSSKIGFLKNRKYSGERMPSGESARLLKDTQPAQDADSKEKSTAEENERIDSGVDFLRAMEEEEPARRKEKRQSSGSKHTKRSSMPSISLSGTKSLITGRFGEAFRRFESNPSDSAIALPPLSPSPDQTPHGLTPIAGSEATDSRSDDGRFHDETEDVPPEMRRELERRRLSQEERRVAEAAAAYKQKVQQKPVPAKHKDGNGHGNEKATSIQTRVRSLLDESKRVSPTKPTATGNPRPQSPIHNVTSEGPTPSLTARTPRDAHIQNGQSHNKTPTIGFKPLPSNLVSPNLTSQTPLPALSSPPNLSAASRSNVPPKPGNKPQLLRQGAARPPSPAKPSHLASKALPSPPPQNPQVTPYPASLSALSLSAQGSSLGHAKPRGVQLTDGAVDDAWESSFSKRYPDLSGLGMIETEIDKARGPPSKGREARKIGEV